MASRLPANVTWFPFISAEEGFDVFEFQGIEEINRPYEFEVELVHKSPMIDLAGLVGSPASFAISDRSGGERQIHGVIRDFSQLHTANERTHYRCYLVPRLWFLGLRSNHRIFQNQNVTEIISSILYEQGFTSDCFAFKCCSKYAPRDYCVQYGETDLHFITRLCEEEGIFFYFDHKQTGHQLCFSDMAGGLTIPGESDLRFFPGSGQRADTAVIDRLILSRSAQSNASMYREWNFQKPRLDLTAAKTEIDKTIAPGLGALSQEIYQYPHLYQLQQPGMRYVDLQLQRQITFSLQIEGDSDVSRLLPGFTFTLAEHPREDVNRKWWLFRVKHHGAQPQSLQHEAPDRGMGYRASFIAIPDNIRYVPTINYPKNRVIGDQTAIVVGPGGEEIYTDEYNRVKVQFHWDREGGNTEHSSCWIRVSQIWAGQEFGGFHTPRIGQEVIVSFLEGDPDRPIVTGRVPNTLNMPPYELPSQKNLSGLQSKEVQGSRRNQVVMDDTNGQIQTQISSDHHLSQLNLGYITRIDHVKGRDDFRGEGFELRTDGWGVFRAAKGMVITTDARQNAESHHKDIKELTDTLKYAVDQHAKQSNLAVEHKGQDADADKQVLQDELEEQLNSIAGTGKAHGELNQPHLVLSSPAGIAATTPNSTHLHSGRNATITASRHHSVAAGHSFLVSALQKVSLFAHKAGMKLFAGRGKVEIQAQSDALDLIAERELRVFSTQETVKISAPKEILLTAGGSYIQISEKGVEIGTKGNTTVKTSNFDIKGPASKPYIPLALPRADLDLEPIPRAFTVALKPALGDKVYSNEPFTLYEDGVEVMKGMTDSNGNLSFSRNPDAKEYKVVTCNGNSFIYEMVEKLPDGEEGEIQRALQQGFRFFEHSSDAAKDKVQGLKAQIRGFTGQKE